jgi:integrase/recombinase XerD
MDPQLAEFQTHLLLERSLSENTVSAYMRDLQKLHVFCIEQGLAWVDVTADHLHLFLQELNHQSYAPKSQARMVSSIKMFFKYLLVEEIRTTNPAKTLEPPKLPKHLPDFLEVEEIDAMLATIDRSTPSGRRDYVVLESLYGLGLRVSELIHLHVSDLELEEGFVRVIGKGNKQRLVPIAPHTANLLKAYIADDRNAVCQGIPEDDTVFLNRFGRHLSRVYIFKLVQRYSELAGIKKKVSPHTFRHSFATHLVHGGADLRSVQEMLGHESITTTEIYTHLDRDYLKSIMQHHPRN